MLWRQLDSVDIYSLSSSAGSRSPSSSGLFFFLFFFFFSSIGLGDLVRPGNASTITPLSRSALIFLAARSRARQSSHIFHGFLGESKLQDDLVEQTWFVSAETTSGGRQLFIRFTVGRILLKASFQSVEGHQLAGPLEPGSRLSHV